MKKIGLLCMAVLCFSACNNSKKQTQTTEKQMVMEQNFCQSCGMPMAVKMPIIAFIVTKTARFYRI
jgi:hypothetical protein